jgi:hypothetical protein
MDPYSQASKREMGFAMPIIEKEWAERDASSATSPKEFDRGSEKDEKSLF